jgi:hypothetical protein
VHEPPRTPSTPSSNTLCFFFTSLVCMQRK